MKFQYASRETIKEVMLPQVVTKAKAKGVEIGGEQLLSEIIVAVTTIQRHYNKKGEDLNLARKIREGVNILKETKFHSEKYGGDKSLYLVYNDLYEDLGILVGNVILHLDESWKGNNLTQTRSVSKLVHLHKNEYIPFWEIEALLNSGGKDKNAVTRLNEAILEFYGEVGNSIDSVFSTSEFIVKLKKHDLAVPTHKPMYELLTTLVDEYLLARIVNN